MRNFLMRCIVATVLLVSPLWSQFDPNIWVVADGLGPSSQVHEIDRAGNLIGSYFGPSAGTNGIAKDLLLGRVLVADSQAGIVRIYKSLQGQIGIVSTPNIGSLAVMANGDIAVLIPMPQFLMPGQVQVVPASGGGTLPPPFTVGFNPTRILCGPSAGNPTIWVLNQLTATSAVSRITTNPPGVAGVNLSSVSTNAPRDMEMRPDGGLVVTFQNVASAALINADGSLAGALTLPEPPLTIACDGDQSLVMIGSSLRFYRLMLPSGSVTDQFPLAAGNYGRIIPDQWGQAWIEDKTNQRLSRYDFGGTIAKNVPLPHATVTPGDPLGLNFAAKTNPDADVDNDGVSSGVEIARGTDVFNGTDVPPSLTLGMTTPGRQILQLSAINRPARASVILAGVSGSVKMPFNPWGAPYFGIQGDFLSLAILYSDPMVTPYFPGMPLNLTDAMGLASAEVDLRTIPSLPPGFVTLSVSCVLSRTSIFDSIDVTSNVLMFPNP